MHLVHVAAKKFILLLNPLNKSLWSNHTCLLLLGIDLGTLPQHTTLEYQRTQGLVELKASDRTSTQKSNICTTASQTHKSMCKQSLSTEPGIKITLASHSSCNQGYKLSIQINNHYNNVPDYSNILFAGLEYLFHSHAKRSGLQPLI
jgi:hypothetical protein